MKKILVMLVAIGLFGAMPALADHKKEAEATSQETVATHSHHDEDCAKECDLLLKECSREVDSIQQRAEKIKAAIKANGAKPENLEELKLLNKKLKEVNETMRAISKPGR